MVVELSQEEDQSQTGRQTYTNIQTDRCQTDVNINRLTCLCDLVIIGVGHKQKARGRWEGKHTNTKTDTDRWTAANTNRLKYCDIGTVGVGHKQKARGRREGKLTDRHRQTERDSIKHRQTDIL